MVTNSFFLYFNFCLHYALILRSAEVSPNVPQNIILGRAECSAEVSPNVSQNINLGIVECSAEVSPNVPQNTILWREDWIILTWKLHHLFTIPWYYSILAEILLILGLILF